MYFHQVFRGFLLFLSSKQPEVCCFILNKSQYFRNTGLSAWNLSFNSKKGNGRKKSSWGEKQKQKQTNTTLDTSKDLMCIVCLAQYYVLCDKEGVTEKWDYQVHPLGGKLNIFLSIGWKTSALMRGVVNKKLGDSKVRDSIANPDGIKKTTKKAWGKEEWFSLRWLSLSSHVEE